MFSTFYSLYEIESSEISGFGLHFYDEVWVFVDVSQSPEALKVFFKNRSAFLWMDFVTGSWDVATRVA